MRQRKIPRASSRSGFCTGICSALQGFPRGSGGAMFRTHILKICDFQGGSIPTESHQNKKDTLKGSTRTGICLALQGFARRNGEAGIRTHSTKHAKRVRAVFDDGRGTKKKSTTAVVFSREFRRWRIYPRSAPDKRACRSSSGVCEPISVRQSHTGGSIPTGSSKKR